MRRKLRTETETDRKGQEQAPDSSFRAGEVIQGKYRLERLLGCGGMGAVWLAAHVGMQTKRAIKLLHDNLGKDEAYHRRFVREAQAAGTLQSRHVAKVLDYDCLPSGEPFLVMELCEGEDLATVLTRAPLSVSDAAGFVIQACDALAEAHAKGIVHRDVKPSNLLLTRSDGEPCIKVADFGIAKVPRAAEDTSHPRTEGFVGTSSYASPEQIRSTAEVDPRTDIWSLGVTLYELVTGKRPFDGATPHQTLARILEETPAPPSAHRSGVPPAFDEVVLACLRNDRDARIPSVTALASALLPLTAMDVGGLVKKMEHKGGGEPAPAPTGSRGGAPGGGTPLIEAPEKKDMGLDATVLAPAPVPRPRTQARWMVGGFLVGAAAVVAVLVSWPSPVTGPHGEDRERSVAPAPTTTPSTSTSKPPATGAPPPTAAASPPPETGPAPKTTAASARPPARTTATAAPAPKCKIDPETGFESCD